MSERIRMKTLLKGLAVNFASRWKGRGQNLTEEMR